MIFSSSTFFVFFISLLFLYWGAKTHRQRAGLLLAGSIIFYASWKIEYLVLLFISLFVNYQIYCALLKNRSRALLWLGIGLDLAVLVFYKYIGLAIETLLWLDNYVGLGSTNEMPSWIDWALPLGISFFTFQMLSALIDVYRGDWARKITFSKWCLYVSFFPQLIAGPIVRAHELVEQLDDLKPLSVNNLRMGALIFTGGLIKKVLFADNLGPIVDELFAQPDSLNLGMAWFASVAFGLQIYFDFSGYSEMALGLARIFGVTLPRNFRYPYISRNFPEFWRRWHITLSQWLRDYLYIGMGGSRRSRYCTYQNLMVTMLLGGLWHGAGWTFVFWGGLHGAYLVGYRFLKHLYELLGINNRPCIVNWLSSAGLPLTFCLTCFTWVFFRATSFDDAWVISAAMLGLGGISEGSVEVRLYQQLILWFCLIFVFIEPAIVKFGEKWGERWWCVPFPLRGMAYASLVLLLLIMGGETQKFVYFDF